MGQTTNSLERRYNALLKAFPAYAEPKITIIDMGDWGCFSTVEEYGEKVHYDYDIEHPERYCPNRQHQPPEHADADAAYQARCAADANEPPSFSSRVAADDESAAYTRRDYEPPPPGGSGRGRHTRLFPVGQLDLAEVLDSARAVAMGFGLHAHPIHQR